VLCAVGCLLAVAVDASARGEAGSGLAAVLEQPGAEATPSGAPWSGLSLEDSLRKANAEGRLLLVVTTPTRSRQTDEERRWSNPVLASWVRRHAVLAKVTEPDIVRAMAGEGMNMAPGDDPFVFRNGRLVRVFGTSWPEGRGNQLRLRPPSRATSTYLGSMLRLDWTLRSIEATDPGWLAANLRAAEQSARPPARLAPPNAGPPTDGLDPASAAALWLEQLETAREHVTAGQLDRAADAYLWLWEQAESGPRAGPAAPLARSTLLTSVAAEMRALAAASDRARDLFTRLLEERSAASRPASPEWIMDVLTLARVVDRHLENLEFLDRALNDPDAIGLMPAADRLILEDLLPRAHFNDPVRGSREPWIALRQMSQRLTLPPPGRTPPEQWARAQEFRRWLIGFEAARQIASLLVAGRDEDAGRVAEVIGQVLPEQAPQVLRSAAVAALAARQPRGLLLEWVGDQPPLRRLVERGVPTTPAQR
jgi:hypothetical protein